jgi:hypothetical protein
VAEAFMINGSLITYFMAWSKAQECASTVEGFTKD